VRSPPRVVATARAITSPRPVSAAVALGGEEALEDPLAVALADARPAVAHAKHRAPAALERMELDGLARSVAERVVEQVAQRGVEMLGMDAQRRDGTLEPDLEAGAVRIDEAREERAERHVLHELRRALDAREVEQPRDEPLHALGVLLDVCKEPRALLVAHRAPLLREQLRRAADRRDRRLQLVAHRRGELGDVLGPVGELGDHLIERAGELAQLLGCERGQRHGRPTLAARELARAACDPAQRARERPREEERQARP
jgi:hypothetical protein